MSLVQVDAPGRGRRSRYLGPEVPDEDPIWQDPLPSIEPELLDRTDIVALKERILATDLFVCELASVAWAAASTFSLTGAI